MKNLLLVLILLGITFSIYQPAYADEIDKIVDQHKKAVGGDAAKNVKSTIIEGSIKKGNESLGRYLYKTQESECLRTDIELNNSKQVLCYTGISAWQQDSSGVHILLGIDAKTLRLEAILANSHLRDLSNALVGRTYLGKMMLDGQTTEVIDFFLIDSHIKLWFDTTTHLILKQERDLNEGAEETFYRDYRKVDGIMEPFALTIKNPTTEFQVKVEQITHNTKINTDVFLYPKATEGKPLPDIEAFLKDVRANQENIEQIREDYAFHLTSVEKDINDKGKIGSIDTKTYEVFPIAGTFVRRLTGKDNRELSEDEKKKAEKEFKKEVEEAKKNKKKEQEDQKKGKDAPFSILNVLKICKVRSIYRDTYRNHQVLCFEFANIKDYKGKNLEENLVSKLAGTIFIDEVAKQVVRLDGRFVEGFKLIGGLVSIAPSSFFILEQEKVHDEIWLPSYSEGTLGVRLLFAKARGLFANTSSDYRKYQTGVELQTEDEPKIETK